MMIPATGYPCGVFGIGTSSSVVSLRAGINTRLSRRKNRCILLAATRTVEDRRPHASNDSRHPLAPMTTNLEKRT